MSLRKAINDKCRECIYDERGSGTWRQQVEACTAFKCPLYPVRPVSSGQKDPELASVLNEDGIGSEAALKAARGEA